MNEFTNIDNSREHLLIADHSTIMRRALVKILDGEFQLSEASTAAEAWQLLQDQTVHAVLMGLNLTDLREYGLLERIRDARVAEIRHTPVAIVAEESPRERERAEEFGASAFFPQPFDSAALKLQMRTLLESGGVPDLEERERQEREATMVDPLTGLPNRSYFFYRGPKELSFAQRHNKEMAVLLVQMDHVETLISEHGRSVVKQLLKKLAKYIKAAVRTEDTVARVGARRFAVIAPTTSEFGAKELADRVMNKVRTTVFNYTDKQVSFSVSMGLAAPRVHSMETFDEVVDLCAQRLDMAVWAGGNRLVFGDQQPEPVDSPEREPDSDADLGVDIDLADDTGVYTAVRPAISTLAELAASDVVTGNHPPEGAPALEVAMWLLENGQSDKLRPHYRLLLEEILPLLEHANGAMNLDIDEALDKLRAKLK
jgi:diguanylate cyclase (GGDEF)-like protein